MSEPENEAKGAPRAMLLHAAHGHAAGYGKRKLTDCNGTMRWVEVAKTERAAGLHERFRKCLREARSGKSRSRAVFGPQERNGDEDVALVAFVGEE